MRYLVVLAALLVTPIAADADFIGSRDIDVEVTISVAGTVPLAGGDLVLHDTFDLTGTGDAFIAVAIGPPPSVFQSEQEVRFHVSGGGTSAFGTVFEYEARDHGLLSAGWLMLDTPLYSLEFSSADAFIFIDGIPIETVFFGAGSGERRASRSAGRTPSSSARRPTAGPSTRQYRSPRPPSSCSSSE